MGIFVCGDVVSSQCIEVCPELARLLSENLSLCNLEAPIAGVGSPITKAGPHMHQDVSIIADLAELGFDVFCLANNHIFDYGASALQKTMETITQHKKTHIGAYSAFAPPPNYLTQINNTHIGIINAGESQFGALDGVSAFLGAQSGYVDLFSESFLSNIIELRPKVDVLIAIVHAGLENVDLPLPQFRTFYKFLCDMGVDIIIGHHPHWAQGYEYYHTRGKECVIFYSLGNFAFYMPHHTPTQRERESFSVLLDFANGALKDFRLYFHTLTPTPESCKVAICKEDELSFSLEALNAPLKDAAHYQQAILSIAKAHYEEYRFYYELALLAPSKRLSFLGNLKTLLKRYLFPHRGLSQRQALLLHNIHIPTHRFVQEIALKALL